MFFYSVFTSLLITRQPWDNIPLTLETVNPTFGAQIPVLKPWSISVQRFSPFVRYSSTTSATPTRSALHIPADHKKGDAIDTHKEEFKLMPHQASLVGTNGTVSATFLVPGLATIPSDDAIHNITIVQLSLDVSMSWIATPKLDTKASIKVRG